MLTSDLMTLDKKFKVEVFSWDLCTQHLETSKNNFFLHENYQIFSFLIP